MVIRHPKVSYLITVYKLRNDRQTFIDIADIG